MAYRSRRGGRRGGRGGFKKRRRGFKPTGRKGRVRRLRIGYRM